MDYKALSEEQWRLMFQLVTPTPWAGEASYEEAVEAARGTSLEYWEMLRAYFEHLAKRYERLTTLQLNSLWVVSQKRGLSFDFILEHHRSYLV